MGTYSEISLKEARERRDEARSLIAKGVDPRSQHREEKRAASTGTVKTFKVVANEGMPSNRHADRKEGRRHPVAHVPG
ncbi:integrase arm-type DNA-binding domain-containing protein [Pseudomonas purpurea]|uniref:integrase arm-type DNA-binding domain-containing protein n=1 Tax=Pseudomonas purpurea TaxID=3136737 RepID=UPI0034613C5B